MASLAAPPGSSARPAPARASPGARPWPGDWEARDPWLWLLALGTLALQLFAWTLTKGYPNADAVEYLDRAQLWVEGDLNGEGVQLRSLGFSSLFVPLFVVAKALRIQDLRAIPYLATAFQILTALALVLVCARLSSKLAGRRAGLAAGWMLALNPVLITYSVNPVSGVMCALFVALALDRGLFERGARSSLWTGLLLGLAVLMAFQALLIVVPIVGLLVLRNGFRGRRESAALMLGLLLAVAILALLDKIVYGRWAISLRTYVVAQYGSALVPVLYKLGLVDLARDLYDSATAVFGGKTGDAGLDAESLRRLYPIDWYFRRMPTFLVWPVLALVALGLLRALWHPRWSSWIPLLVLGIAAAVMSGKGSKEFRLWLPLLPLIAPLAALGWEAWTKSLRARGSLARETIGVVALGAAVPLVVIQLQQVEWRKHGNYWDAVSWIESQQVESQVPDKLLSAYTWAVHLRTSPRLQLLRCPLDPWKFEAPETSEWERESLLGVLRESEWFVTHLSALQTSKDLARKVSRNFFVRAVFYDQEENSHLGPVFVFQRADPERRGPRLFEYWSDGDPYDYVRKKRFERIVRFSDAGESALLLGWDYQRLPGDWGWLTLHWMLESKIERNWDVQDSLMEQASWTFWYDNHLLGMGMLPPELNRAGTIIAEGRLVVPAERIFIPGEPFRPLGFNWRRGELIPTQLSVKVAILDEQGLQIGRVPPSLPGEGKPLSDRLRLPNLWHPRGERLARDGAVVVGGIFVPVARAARHPDDGSPVPEVRILRPKKKRPLP
jgi:4-amino-4-deoxy-L-arabinose transferase-like glycosyltransferase